MGVPCPKPQGLGEPHPPRRGDGGRTVPPGTEGVSGPITQVTRFGGASHVSCSPPPPEDRGSLGGTLTQATWFWGSLAAPPPSPPDRGDFGGDPYPVGVLGLRRFGDPSPQTTKFGETLTLPPQDRGGFGGEDPHPQAMRFRGGSQDSGGLGGPRQWGCTCPGMFWGTPAPGQRFAPPPPGVQSGCK